MDSPYLTTTEVASYLRVDAATVRRWCQDGTLTAARAGKSLRIRREDLERFVGHPVTR